MNRTDPQNRQYPILIIFMEEADGGGYYIAYLPDFGFSACSAVGDTPIEALEELSEVKRDVIQYYLNTGRPIPEPSKPLENQQGIRFRYE